MAGLTPTYKSGTTETTLYCPAFRSPGNQECRGPELISLSLWLSGCSLGLKSLLPRRFCHPRMLLAVGLGSWHHALRIGETVLIAGALGQLQSASEGKTGKGRQTCQTRCLLRLSGKSLFLQKLTKAFKPRSERTGNCLLFTFAVWYDSPAAGKA